MEFETALPVPYIELDEDERMVQIMIFQNNVGVSIPYFREQAQSMLEFLADTAEVLRSVAGYTGYDCQLDQIITPSNVMAMVDQYRAMDTQLPEILAFSQQSRMAKNPWWKFW